MKRVARLCYNEACLKPPVIAITGPTGAGKSALAFSLARRQRGEIVNADSVQLYEGFDIGSAKPSRAFRDELPHHLFSVITAEQPFSAGDYRREALRVIGELANRGSLPIVVGGSGLYLRALLTGLADVPAVAAEAKEAVHRKVQALAGRSKREISQELHRWLGVVDRASADRLHPGDSTRVRRALEVVLSAGQSLVQYRAQLLPAMLRALVVCLLPEREVLYPQLDLRVEEMLRDGLVQEVAGLLERYPRTAKPLTAIGYRQVVGYLTGESDYATMALTLKRDTRRFAKRQYTWFRNQPAALGWRILEGVPGDNSDLLHEQIYEFCVGDGVFSDSAIYFLPVVSSQRG